MRDHHVDGHPQTPNVTLLVVGCGPLGVAGSRFQLGQPFREQCGPRPTDDLRCHVIHAAQPLPQLVPLYGPCQSKINELYGTQRVVGKHPVLGLDVPVAHPGGVAALQRPQHLSRDHRHLHLSTGHISTREPVVQISSSTTLHDYPDSPLPRPLALLVNLPQASDVWMVQSQVQRDFIRQSILTKRRLGLDSVLDSKTLDCH
mmetsp:Transcript_54327/g.119129  ORF Transcript_54327/g.119129 Transcript_54327/m.119129 type:complete len:202 (-) Transcript_54327:593-1198(-)